jgi:flagellar biosynthesis anti-sigma factor FlgM
VRIDPNSPDRISGRQLPVSARNRITGTTGSGSSDAGAPLSSDQAVLSARAERLLKVRPQLDALPETSREERIAALRAAIAGGTYAVDGEQIADAMLRDDSVASLLRSPTA